MKSLRILSAIGIIAGCWSMIFELYFFQKFILGIYFARLLFTIIAFSIFTLSYKEIGKKTSNVLTHVYIISLISSFAFTIYKIPSSVYINSQILSLLIFTTAIIFSWEIKNQIIVAIYYNLLFAFSIIYNDRNIYLLPNIYSLIIFVCLISSLSVVASFVNYNLRKKYRIRSEEIDFLFDSVPVGICRSDLHGTILTCNRYFNSLLGIIENKKESNLISLFKSESFAEYFRNVCSKDGGVEILNFSYPNDDDPTVYLKISGKKIISDIFRQSIEFIISDNTKDIILAKEREKASEQLLNETRQRELIAQNALLEKKHKLELLAKINHEVRTPLNSILIYFEMIDDGLLKSIDEIKKYSKSVKTASQSLLQTINNFIDYVKIETGKIEVDCELFNLNEEVESIIQLLTPLASSKKNRLAFINNNSSKNLVYTDAIKFRQILINLIANAVKFTHNGSITVFLENNHKYNNEYEITFYIEDTGPGISEDKLKTIFDPFVSLKDGDRSNYNSGLGLTICSEFLNLMRGEISVTSEIGIGTRFTVRIPYKYSYPENVN